MGSEEAQGEEKGRLLTSVCGGVRLGRSDPPNTWTVSSLRITNTLPVRPRGCLCLQGYVWLDGYPVGEVVVSAYVRHDGERYRSVYV